MQGVTVGRIVRVNWYAQIKPAVVTSVWSDGETVDAVVLGAEGYGAAYLADGLRPGGGRSDLHGTWWWPVEQPKP